MSTVGTMTAVAGLVLFALIVGFGLWAVRRQSRMFPKDFDRTGWNPERGHAGWFATR
jgi:hypothetical protein